MTEELHWWACFTCGERDASEAGKVIYEQAAYHKADNPMHDVRGGHGRGPTGILTEEAARKVLERGK